MKIFRRRALAVAVVLVVVLASAWTLWHFIAARRLEAAFGRLRAAGLPTSPADLDRPLPPPERNAAHLYRAAFSLAGSLGLPKPDWKDLLVVSPEVRDRLPALDEPLSFLRRAGKLPECRFLARHGADEEWPILREVTTGADRLGFYLLKRAILREEEGRLDDAASDLADLFQMTRALGSEPMCQIWRFTLSQQALLVLEGLLPRLDPAGAAIERIRPDDGRGGFAFAFLGEVALGADCFRRWRTQDTPSPWWWPRWLLSPYYMSDQAELIDQLIARREALQAPHPEAESRIVELERTEKWGFFASLVMVRCSGFVTQEARTGALADLAAIAARFYDHRKARGAFPPKLEDLPGPPAPLDPLSGKPYEVSVEDGKTVLRSPANLQVCWRLE